MKTTFVATVLNEQASISAFLDSLARQSKKPDETIIVDAGSKDQTCALIKKHSLKPRLIIRRGLNRSQGRNIGIKSALHRIIALSDAGCVLDKDWLLRITEPLVNSQIDSVAGYYQTIAGSVLAQAMAPFVAVMPDKFNPQTYLPSSRSLAFKKSAWLKAGQYPENLDFNEDIIFAANLKSKTHMAVKSQAIVMWQLPDNLNLYYQKIMAYAAGDVQAGYWPHIAKISTGFLRYVVFFSAPPLFLAYLFWPIIKFNHYVSSFKAVVCLPLIQITTDLAIMRGALLGLKIRLQKLVS